MCISWCGGGGKATMTWTLVLVLSAIAYACKVTGLVIIGGRELPEVADRCLSLIPAALVSALIVNSTIGGDDGIVVDARAVGVVAAILVATKRAPLVVVIATGAAVTAVVRAIGLAP